MGIKEIQISLYGAADLNGCIDETGFWDSS